MKKILPVIFILWSSWAFSQGEMTLPMMEHVYQSTYYNPAAVPDHKVSIGLPGISSVKAGYINSGIVFTNGLVKQNGSTVFNVDNLISTMQTNNYIYSGGQVDLFHFRIKWRNSFLSFDAGNTTDINMNLPKSFFEIATLKWSEPGTQNGRNFDLSSLDMRSLSYNHYSIGLSKMFKHFNIGGRFNLLQGIASGVVESNNLNVGVSSDAISLTNSATVYSSGSNTKSGDVSNLFKQFKNLGASVDFGVTYKIRERLFLGVSVNNIGFIDWKNDVVNTTYTQTAAGGPFTGVNVFGPILRGDSLNNVKVVDSVKTHFASDSNKVAYKTWLTPRVYFSVNYKLTNRFNVTALVKFEKYIDWRYALTLGAQYKFGRFLSLTASSTYQYDVLSFGAGIVVKPGPFQIYAVSDNLFPTLYKIDKIGSTAISTPLPFDAKMLNIRVGMNLVFGRILAPKKQTFAY